MKRPGKLVGNVSHLLHVIPRPTGLGGCSVFFRKWTREVGLTSAQVRPFSTCGTCPTSDSLASAAEDASLGSRVSKMLKVTRFQSDSIERGRQRTGAFIVFNAHTQNKQRDRQTDSWSRMESFLGCPKSDLAMERQIYMHNKSCCAFGIVQFQ